MLSNRKSGCRIESECSGVVVILFLRHPTKSIRKTGLFLYLHNIKSILYYWWYRFVRVHEWTQFTSSFARINVGWMTLVVLVPVVYKPTATRGSALNEHVAHKNTRKLNSLLRMHLKSFIDKYCIMHYTYFHLLFYYHNTYLKMQSTVIKSRQRCSESVKVQYKVVQIV